MALDRETLTQAIAAVDAERLHYPTDTVGDLGYNCAIDDCVKALEQLRDAAQRGEKTLNHAETKLQGITNWLIGAQRGLEGKRKDEWSNGYGEALKHALFALDTEIPAPVGGQTPTEPPQTSRSELMRHAVQRGGRPMDVAALPAPVGGQTHPRDAATLSVDVEGLRATCHATFNGGHHEDATNAAFHHGMDTVCNMLADPPKWTDAIAQPAPVGGQTPPLSPVLAYQEWATRRAEQFGPLSQDQYLLAQEAFFAAHPGEGPSSQFIEKVGGQTPTEPPQDIENAKLTRILEIERRQYERLNLCPDHRDKASGRCIVCDGERRGRENAAAPPPPGAPPAFTREAVLAKIKQFEFQGGFLETVAMLKAYALTLPTEGR